MEIKDWITIITLIITIISAHWLASKQTRKNKKAKWIEDFRVEIAKFIAISNLINPNKVDSLYNLSECSYVILMLLDDKNKSHKILNSEIVAFGNFAVNFTASRLNEYKIRIEKIIALSKEIIRQEEKKI